MNIILLFVSVVIMSLLSFFHISHRNINRLKLEIEKKNLPKYIELYTKMTRESNFYNNFITSGYFLSIIIALTSISWEGYESLPLKALIITIVVLYTIGYYPKLIVRRDPELYLKLLTLPTYAIYILLYPITYIIDKISQFTYYIFDIESNISEDILFSKDDLSLLLSEATGDNGDEGADEKDVEILENALQLSEIKVRDCMIQTSDIEAVELNESAEEVKERFVMSNFSRLPVYRESIYNIIGYINVKQLFDSFHTTIDMMQKVIYVPETLSAQKMLTQFTVNRKSIAAVVNEFGESVGIITLEDVLEEIFGDIEDEYDSSDIIEYQLEENQHIISAKVSIEHLNSKYNAEIPLSDDYDTLAGYILNSTQSIPLRGEIIILENMKVKIIKRNDRRIDLVKITFKKS